MSIDKLILEKYFEKHTDAAIKKLSSLTDNEILSVIKNLTDKNVYKVFSRIERYRAIKIFDLLGSKNSAEIIENIPSPVAGLILRQMEKDKLNSLLIKLSDKKAIQFRTMLQYDELSVGALMSVNVFTLSDDLIINDALENVKRYNENIPAQIFVVNRDQKIKGKVNLHQLIRCNSKDELRTIIDSNIPKISPKMNIKSIIDHKGWRENYLLPVIDGDDLFLGVIKLEVVRNIIEIKSKKKLKQFTDAGSALGELYRIGISGLIRTAAEISARPENDNH